MTCGGILFGVLVLGGGLLLSDFLNADWPFVVAIGLILVLICFRLVEFLLYRSQVRQLDRVWDRRMRSERLMSAEAPVDQVVTCASCGRKNRVPARGRAVCSICGWELSRLPEPGLSIGQVVSCASCGRKNRVAGRGRVVCSICRTDLGTS